MVDTSIKIAFQYCECIDSGGFQSSYPGSGKKLNACLPKDLANTMPLCEEMPHVATELFSTVI